MSNNKLNKVVITGVAGFIGMHTAIRFLQEGWNVIGIDNINDYYSQRLKRDRIQIIKSNVHDLKTTFTFHERDINSNIWDEISHLKIDAVIHLAAQAGVRYSLENPRAYLESNIMGFQSVLEFIESKSIDKFLYASSSSVYGKNSVQPFSEEQACNHPESYYAATKKANEQMAYAVYKTKNISSIGLRFFTVYGPWGRPDMAPMLFATAASKNETIRVFNFGKQKRDFTYIDDIVEGVFRLTVAPNISGAQVCNIGFGKPSALGKFIELIEAEFDVIMHKEYVEAQPGDVEETYASTQKLENLVSYRPNISLEIGINKFTEWFKSYYDGTN